MTGGCLCGAVRFRLAHAPDAFGACHCKMCQRWTGAPYLGVEVAGGDVAWQGEPAVYASSDWGERGFCAVCGSTLFWRMRDGSGSTVLSLGAFDETDGIAFASEIFIDEKPAAYAFAGDRTRQTGAEVMVAIRGGA